MPDTTPQARPTRLQILVRTTKFSVFPQPAKATGTTAAFDHATDVVAKYFIFSEAKVRKLCTKARAKRAECVDEEPIQEMRLAQFERWAQNGGDF